ncbi:MAG: type II secretion system F family protein [Thermoguttaceae bacterium]
MGAGNSAAATITLDQLIALNDEMAALVRAGVPLEHGLEALGGDLAGQPGRLAQLLVGRMNSGESLSRILADDNSNFPPVWRAVVEAGIRSGHLAAALESLSLTARRISELRKTVLAGLVYPVVVVSLAYLLFIFLLLRLIPLMARAHLDLTGRADRMLAVLGKMGETAPWWAIPLPLVAAVLLVAWWRRSGRAVWAWRGRGKSSGYGRRGGFRGTIQMSRMATFTEVLSLLVKERVPLEDALVLAGEASGDRAIARASAQVAERLRRGDRFEKRDDLPVGLPPLLGWLLMSADRQQDLGAALSRTAAVYRNRAARKALWTALYLPIWLTVLVGGTATLICGMITFAPLLRLFYQLSAPVGM